MRLKICRHTTRRYYCSISFNSAVAHHAPPSRTPNSHARHADFHQKVPNSFGNYVPDIGIFGRLRRYILPKISTCHSSLSYDVAETKISAGPSRITRPAELNEIVQYLQIDVLYMMKGKRN